MLEEAGLTEVRVTAEADAGGLLLDSPDMRNSVTECGCAASVPGGLVSSIHVAARRPGGGPA
jgi:hypothetical protein